MYMLLELHVAADSFVDEEPAKQAAVWYEEQKQLQANIQKALGPWEMSKQMEDQFRVPERIRPSSLLVRYSVRAAPATGFRGWDVPVLMDRPNDCTCLSVDH